MADSSRGVRGGVRLRPGGKRKRLLVRPVGVWERAGVDERVALAAPTAIVPLPGGRGKDRGRDKERGVRAGVLLVRSVGF